MSKYPLYTSKNKVKLKIYQHTSFLVYHLPDLLNQSLTDCPLTTMVIKFRFNSY